MTGTANPFARWLRGQADQAVCTPRRGDRCANSFCYYRPGTASPEPIRHPYGSLHDLPAQPRWVGGPSALIDDDSFQLTRVHCSNVPSAIGDRLRPSLPNTVWQQSVSCRSRHRGRLPLDGPSNTTGRRLVLSDSICEEWRISIGIRRHRDRSRGTWAVFRCVTEYDSSQDATVATNPRLGQRNQSGFWAEPFPPPVSAFGSGKGHSR